MCTINHVFAFNRELAAGPTADGYPRYLVCRDGEPLCFSCGQNSDNVGLIRDAIIDPSARSEWQVVAVEVSYDSDAGDCAHCGNPVECGV